MNGESLQNNKDPRGISIALRALYELLAGAQGIFARPQELTRFVALEVDLALTAEFPSELASLAETTFSVLRVLQARGLVGPEFFAALVEFAPSRVNDITSVAGLWYRQTTRNCSFPQQLDTCTESRIAEDARPNLQGQSRALHLQLHNSEYGLSFGINVNRRTTIGRICELIREHLSESKRLNIGDLGFSLEVTLLFAGEELDPNARLLNFDIQDGYTLNVQLSFSPYVRGKRGERLVFKRTPLPIQGGASRQPEQVQDLAESNGWPVRDLDIDVDGTGESSWET